MHVAPGLTQHLQEQPQLRAAVRGMIAGSAAGGVLMVQGWKMDSVHSTFC
jgi:hypothetical protein